MGNACDFYFRFQRNRVSGRRRTFRFVFSCLPQFLNEADSAFTSHPARACAPALLERPRLRVCRLRGIRTAGLLAVAEVDFVLAHNRTQLLPNYKITIMAVVAHYVSAVIQTT